MVLKVERNWFAFDNDLDGTSQRGLAVLEVQKLGTRVIQPAPLSFGGAQF